MSRFIECEACHNILSDKAAFCPKCGHPVLSEERDSRPSKEQPAAPKMHSSEKVALGALVIGVACCLVMKEYLTFPWWPSIIVGALAAGGSYGTLLQLTANEHIVDSKVIGRK